MKKYTQSEIKIIDVKDIVVTSVGGDTSSAEPGGNTHGGTPTQP